MDIIANFRGPYNRINIGVFFNSRFYNVIHANIKSGY
jgi:hypothetical protein